MNRFKLFLITLIAVFFIFPSRTVAEDVPPAPAGDVEEGAVPETLIFHGRLNRNGAPYSGTVSLQMKLYFSQNNSLIWESPVINGVMVEQGLFSQNFIIPLDALAREGEKYYKIFADGVPVLDSSLSSDKYILDTVPYSFAAKAVEEKSFLTVSDLVLDKGGNIYLSSSRTGTVSCSEEKKGSIVFISSNSCQGDTSTSGGNEIRSDAYVFVNAKNKISLYAGDTYYTENPEKLAMVVSTSGNVGIGTGNPDTLLHVNGDAAVWGQLYGNSQGKIVIADNNVLNVSTITRGNGSVLNHEKGGIYFENNALRFKAITNLIEKKQLFIDSGNILINSPDSNLIDGDNIFVNGSAHAEDGILSGSVFISTDNTIMSYGGSNNLIFQPGTGNGNMAIGSQMPSQAKLRVSDGGMIADTITISGPATFNSDMNIRSLQMENLNTEVHLSSTVINGTLQVSGNSAVGNPAYSERNNFTNVFTKPQLFSGDVKIGESDNSGLIVNGTLAVSASAAERGNGKYLQVGDSMNAYRNKDTYLFLNASAESSPSVAFYKRYGANNVLVSSISAADIMSDSALAVNSSGNTVVISSAAMHSVRGGSFIVSNNSRYVLNAVPANGTSENIVYFGNYDNVTNANAIVSGQLYVNKIHFHDGTEITGSYTGPDLSEIRYAGNIIVRTSTGSVRMQSSGSNALVISNSGNVGISLNNPSQKLTLSGSSSIMAGDALISDPAIKVKVNNLIASGDIKTENGSVHIGTYGVTGLISNDGVFSSLSWNGTPINVQHGGTGLNAAPDGIIRYISGPALTSSPISLNSEAEGLLSVSHGGTGQSLSGLSGALRSYSTIIGTGTVNISAGSSDLISGTILGLSNGGTGAVSFLPGIMYSSGQGIAASLSTSTINLASGSNVSGRLSYSNGGFTNSSNSSSLGSAAKRLFIVNNSSAPAYITLYKGWIPMAADNRIIISTEGFSPGESSVVIDKSIQNEINVKLAQDLRPAASPTFAGLYLSEIPEGILYSDSEGYFSTHTLVLSNHLSDLGTVPIDRGGTNRSSFDEGPIISASGMINTGKINLSNNASSVLPVSHGGTGLYSISNGSLLKTASANSIVPLAIESGYTVIGGASGPQSGIISGTDNQVIVSTASGSITLSLPQNIHAQASPVFSGLKLTGFNGLLSSYSGIISANSPIKLSSSAFSGVLQIDSGGTGSSSYSGQGLLHNTSSGFSKSQVNLASEVSGILPIANGGTSQNLSGKQGILKIYDLFIGTGTLNIADESEDNLVKTNGGTGLSGTNPFTANTVIGTDSSGNIQSSISLAYGQILLGQSSGAPVAGIISGTANQITVSTSTSGSDPVLTISLPQDISQSSVVNFSSVTVTGTLTALNDMKLSGNINSHTLTVDTLNVGMINIPYDGSSRCESTDSGVTGELKICKYRWGFLGDHSTFYRLVYYDGSKWRCTDGKEICRGVIDSVCGSDKCHE